MSLLADLQQYPSLGQVRLPSQIFFDPLPIFWEKLRKHVPADVKLIDCGTGMGHIPQLGRELGFDIEGIDTCLRDDQDLSVRIADALHEVWGKDRWPLVCRPCHNGFTHKIFCAANAAKVPLIYVSKPANLFRDIGRSGPQKIATKVGKDGETLYITNPKTQIHLSYHRAMGG